MRFGVGDKVLVKPSLASEKEIRINGTLSVTNSMRSFAGQLVTIKLRHHQGFVDFFQIEEDVGANVWWDDLFLPVAENAVERTVEDASPYKGEGSEASDPVAHPAHYTYGKIEVIDFIQDKDLNFALGNAVKYIVRAGHKAEQGMSDEEKAIQDLEKARQYIDFEIEHRKGVR